MKADKIAIHKNLCTKMHDLYERKNADYGDSFSQLRTRYPNFVCMRIFDKLNRLETIMQPGYECKVSDETVEDTLMDIANYAVMEIVERQAAKLDSVVLNYNHMPRSVTTEEVKAALKRAQTSAYSTETTDTTGKVSH